MTYWRGDLVRRATSAFSPRRIVLGVTLIWLITGAIFHFSHRWLLLLSTGTSIVTLLILFLILTGHRQKTHTLSEKLDQLGDDLKTEAAMVLRKLHTKHRNGQDS